MCRKMSTRSGHEIRAQGGRRVQVGWRSSDPDPLIAPRANAHAERWIGSCGRRCLDWMLVLNERHLEEILREYCLHHNHERPHRSRNLRPPGSRGDPITPVGERLERSTRLGGCSVGTALLRDIILEPHSSGGLRAGG